ncbi:MAG: quinol dehydrogenase ferredoxin subunit NapH [Epsilonproteobacteria bacterium]|nr:quinol dehydrogenase ferredoxin subunit NapH [Campylobacterota bacterium]
MPLSKTFFVKNAKGKVRASWRFWRWFSVIAIHLIFFLSFAVDIQILEGTLNASRFLGFHMIDPFTTLEVFAAEHHMGVNLIIGTATIVVIYLLIGGRTYCGWVCPYSLLADIAESLHHTLIRKNIINKRPYSKLYSNKIKYAFWVLFLALAAGTGYIVFESINVVGLLSRAIVYGWSVALLWVLVVFIFDVFVSSRAWCTYICPVGTTYSLIGWASATKVEWNDNCDHCMACSGVCPEPHILELTKAKYAKGREEKGVKSEHIISGDCTMCGRCIDVCHSDALGYNFRLTDLL